MAAAAAALMAAEAIRRRAAESQEPTVIPAPRGRAVVDSAVDRRVLSWSRQSPDAATTSASLSPERERDAVDTLRDLASRMPDADRDAIETAVSEGRVRARLLGPEDGMVWEIPGRRLFEISGVQAFSVDDPEQSPPSAGSAR